MATLGELYKFNQNKTTAQFTVPAVGANVTIDVQGSYFVGEFVFIEDAGIYSIVSIPAAGQIEAKNEGATINAAPTTVIADNRNITPGGYVSGDADFLDGLDSTAFAQVGSNNTFNGTTDTFNSDVTFNGDVTFMGPFASTPVAVGITAGAVTLDLSSSGFFTTAVTENITSVTATNIIPGGSWTWILTQTGGTFTVTGYGAEFVLGNNGTDPDMPNAVGEASIFRMYAPDASNVYIGRFSKDFS